MERWKAAACAAIAIGVAILGGGCEGPPDFRSANGAAVYLDGVQHSGMTSQTANAMESFLMDGLSAHGWEREHLEHALARAEVHFVSNPFEENGTLLNGSERGTYLKVSVTFLSQDCPWQGAYRHELAHWLQLDIRGEEDPNHTDLTVWPTADDRTMGCPP